MLSWHGTAGALISPRGCLVFGDFFATLAGTDGSTQRLSGRLLFARAIIVNGRSACIHRRRSVRLALSRGVRSRWESGVFLTDFAYGRAP
ncbi:hypothetical protein D7Y27_38665 [Corallococcus sp. AB004]|nr:hypothetical protein D7Y27_38665 [Corallococcus sp. AB004]